MLRDSRLGQGELGPDHVRDRARGLLTVGEQLQNAPAHRVAEDVERVHRTIVTGAAYISKRWYFWSATARAIEPPGGQRVPIHRLTMWQEQRMDFFVTAGLVPTGHRNYAGSGEEENERV